MSEHFNQSRIGVALFGTGRIGSLHFENLLLNQRVDLRWVVETDVESARALVERYKCSKELRVVDFNNVDEVYSDKSLHAVLICTPTSTHEDIVLSAIKQGKAVFCEKPLTTQGAESIRRCYNAANHEKLPLFCAFNRRFERQIREIYNRVKAGNLGKVRLVKGALRDCTGGTPINYLKSSGGILFDAAVHYIDLACWLLGEWPCSVFATGHATNEMISECGDVDCCVMTLTFLSGAIASLDCSREAKYGYDQRLEVLGTEGMLQSENKHPTEMIRWSLDGVHRDPISNNFLEACKESYKTELEHFLDVVQGKAEVDVKGESVLMVNAIAEALKTSMDTNSVVQVEPLKL